MKDHKERKRHKTKKHVKKSLKSDKKSRKDHKKRRDRHSCSSGSSSGSSDTERDHVQSSALRQLERERAAVQAARYIVARHPGVRKHFRDLLWELDNGRAAGVSGVPDRVLRAQLQFTLEHLGLKCTKDQYWLPSDVPSTLSVVGFVFDELPPQRTPAPPQGMITEDTENGAAVSEQQKPAETARPLHKQTFKGPELPPGFQQDTVQPMQQQQKDARYNAGVRVEEQQQQVSTETEADGLKPRAPARPEPRRVVGPAAPSPQQLAAAAAYHAEVEAAGGYGAASGPAPADEAGPLTGPPPPDFVEEGDAAPPDVREAQVMRVLKVLRHAANGDTGAQGATPAAAAAAGVVADPYAVLGVAPSSDAATIRKSYWRLSLLVHPDKCRHPAAQEAFQAVSKAAQLLQDAGQRQLLDEQKADAALRQQARVAAAAAERQVAWHKARGEAVPADLAADLAAARSAGAGPASRESWMTDLPTNQGKTAAQALAMGLSQTSQTAFSRFGVRQPGDTSGWTDTPQQRAMRAAGLLTDSSTASKPALAAPTTATEGAPVTAELAAALSQYTGRYRQKTLLEQHAEQQVQLKQARNKDKKPRGEVKDPGKADKEGKGHKRKAEGGQDDGEWAGKHPWKPWDRDKDLEVQLQRPRAAADLLKAAGNLSSRFSSGK